MTARKITQRQAEVLAALVEAGTMTRPRHTLERLEKKGLVMGDRRGGWRLTPQGEAWARRDA
jgi:Mn-dependent DtxR family transcriptional regulator